jgi:lysine/ornithine N-monooxygenase
MCRCGSPRARTYRAELEIVVKTRFDTEVAIVGAGPYGLSLATHVRERGIDFRIFGRSMSSWFRHMPEGMFLKSEGFASSIADPRKRYTLGRFCAEFGREYGDYGVPASIGTFRDYGRWFQRTLVPDLKDADVRFVRRDDGGFELGIDGSESVRARRVVVACGFPWFRRLPPELVDLPAHLVTHSSEHRDFAGFRGKDVVVFGAGQSALETAALLHEHGASPRVVVRKPDVRWTDPPDTGRRPLRTRIRWPISGLGAGWRSWACCEYPLTFHSLPEPTRIQAVREMLGPSGAWWLRNRVEDLVPVLPGHRLASASAENGGVRLRLVAADGAERDLLTERVIAATGYRVGVEQLSFLEPDLRARLRLVAGAPQLSRSFESSTTGLYFVGLAAANSFGPVMRFVCGTSFASRRVASHLDRSR